MVESAGRLSVFVGTAGTAALNIATTVINFVLALVLTRALGTGGYGAYAYAFAWATFLSVPASLGLTPLVIRHVASYAAHERWGLLKGVILRTHQVVLASAVLLMGGGALVGSFVHGSSSELETPFLIGLLLIPLMSLTSLRQGVLKGFNRVVLGRVPETLIVPGLFLALALVAWLALGDGFDASWAVSLNVVAVFFAFAIGTLLLRRVVPSEVREARAETETRGWVRSAGPLLAIGVLLVLNGQLGVIALGSLADAKAAGIFSVVIKVSAFTSFFYLAASYPLYPSVARLWALGDTESIEKLLTRTSRFVLAGSLAIGAVILVFGGRILEIFGADFDGGGGLTALRILTVAELVKVAAGYGGLVLMMTPYERSMMLGTGLGVLCNVPLALILIPIWGVSGAAVALSVSGAVSALAFVWLSRRQVGIYGWALGGLPRRVSSA